MGSADIRPPHGETLGRGGAKANEEGYCRIIDSAVRRANEAELVKVAAFERKTSGKYYDEGYSTIGEVSNRVAEEVKKRMGRASGRNEPCPCGSGKKYKKCHGA